MADSDDSDDLEDTPHFILKNKVTQQNDVPRVSMSREGQSKLDDLLSEHKEDKVKEAYIKKTKEEMLSSIAESNLIKERLEDSLTERSAEFIEQLDKSITGPAPETAGLDMFSVEEQCCLFTETLKPSECGFDPSASPLDRLLDSVTPSTLSTIVLSKAFITCLRGVPQADIVKSWLFYIMSIHSSATVSQFCYVNLMNLSQQSKVQTMTSEAKQERLWWPRASDLLKVLVNWGANPDTLLGEQTLYPPLEISDHLTSLVLSRERSPAQAKLDTQLCRNNLALVLNVLSSCLQVRPKVPNEELDLMFSMLAKTSLDVSLYSCLAREHQVCFNSIVECYPKSEWPSRIPRLCGLLSEVSDQPIDQAHLAELLTSGGRGEDLQISFSYLCLHKILCPLGSTPSDQVLTNVELSDIIWLGEPVSSLGESTLAVSLSQLVITDLHNMTWVLELLDLCVGTEHRRAAKPRDQLQYLNEQLKFVMKYIRDSIYKEHQSKIKDALSRMKIKWYLTLQNRKTVQRSIFSWATQNQPTGREQILHDQQLPISDLEDDFNSSN